MLQLRNSFLRRTSPKFRVEEGDGAVGTPEGAALGELQYPYPALDIVAEWEIITGRQVQGLPEWIEMGSLHYQIRSQRGGVLRAEGGIHAAQGYFGPRLQVTDIFYHLNYPGIPIGHHGLDQYPVEAFLSQEQPEIRPGFSEATVTALDIGEGCRFRDIPVFKSAAAPGVTLFRDEEIKEGQPTKPAQPSGDSKHSIGPQPEIVGREIVYRRIDQKDVEHFELPMGLFRCIMDRALPNILSLPIAGGAKAAQIFRIRMNPARRIFVS
jgi:hypothetical protein